MTSTLENVLRTRDIASKFDFPYWLMFPRLLNGNELEEISDWLESNCRDKFSVRNIRNQYSFRFTNNDDFMRFSMRWL